MSEPADTNAAIWQSEGVVAAWSADAARRERGRTVPLQFLAGLLPFGEQDAFTFLDLGAGTGAASRAVLERYPRSSAVLADFSAAMMRAGERELEPFAGRYRYVEFDMSAGPWPAAIPAALDAVVTSMCVHHLPDARKQALFAEILGHLVPGGWYLNFDPVSARGPGSRGDLAAGGRCPRSGGGGPAPPAHSAGTGPLRQSRPLPDPIGSATGFSAVGRIRGHRRLLEEPRERDLRRMPPGEPEIRAEKHDHRC